MYIDNNVSDVIKCSNESVISENAQFSDIL